MSPVTNKNSTSAFLVLSRMSLVHLEPETLEDCQAGEDFDEGKTYTPPHQKPKRSKFKRRSK
jgi:hypothetical protein